MRYFTLPKLFVSLIIFVLLVLLAPKETVQADCACNTGAPRFEVCVLKETLQGCPLALSSSDKCFCIPSGKLAPKQIDIGSVMRGAMPNFKFANATTGQMKSIADIVSAILPFLFVFAGLILLIYLIWGGFGLMTSRGDPKSIDSSKGIITNAIIGFVIIFISYWLIQLLEVILDLPRVF